MQLKYKYFFVAVAHLVLLTTFSGAAALASPEGETTQRPVYRAPADRSGRHVPRLVSLSLTGPDSLSEGASAKFTATAGWSDGSSSDVSSSASWFENSSFASVSGGTLAVQAITGNQTLTLTVSYGSRGITKTAAKSVQLLDSAPPLVGSHAGRFAIYEGTKTCITCHAQQALDMHASVHYQWKGPSVDVANAPTVPSGKMDSINDFCTYPNINWIGKMVNTDGATVDGGCARCHAGLGLKPTTEATLEQLENIDCLVCHSSQYKRTVESVNGAYRFVPNTAAMSVSVLEAATDITRPGKDACLNCHEKSGGGDNFKRGDLEQAHRNPTPDFDVHMASEASGGAGLVCVDCHQTANHKISGRGSDLRPRDSSFIPRCTNCHNVAPHSDTRLNKHVAKVDCTVCHIPTFAKVAATDLHRDWSQPADLDPNTKLFEPHMTKQTDVVPVYKFFNGTSYFYNFGDPTVPESNGKVLMSAPVGGVSDPASRLYPFKRHLGTMAVDPATDRLIPLKAGILFQTGNIPLAIETGAKEVGWTWNGYDFVETERYLGIYHEVAPKEQAISCGTCHDSNRVDFVSLGYKPNSTRNGKPLCASCHGDESGEWTGTAYFWNVHAKHVTDKKLDCINCHTFSRK